ncbi:MAG: HAD family hydrolase [Candidatus Bathyarchaeota archaeon]|nr:HAD family hydrolase [Candidatus Bathyarchaeota archaeon]
MNRNVYQMRTCTIASHKTFGASHVTIKAVVFDLDGTLAEFNLDYKIVRAEVIQFLINQSFPASIFSIKESIFEMLKKAKVYMKNNGKEEQEFYTIQKHVLSIALKHELKAAHGTSILPGVFEMLKTLKKMDLKLAIFTINSKKSTDYILNNFHIKQFFDVVVTREAVSKVKPDPSHLAAALKTLDVNVDEVVVVGDSIVDMRSAKALNAAAVGVATDSDLVKELNYAGAMHIIKSITSLPTLITQLDKNKS